jgi:mannose-1-phosphate guanylyltransferase
MSSDVNALLLAAGLGTRFRPITLQYPKPVIPFLNVPMGFYQFQYLNHLNIEKLVVNTFHLPDQVQSLFESQPYLKQPILFSHEKNEILGSAGGLKKASALMDPSKPILVMNADEIYFTANQNFLKAAYVQHVTNENLATLIVMPHAEAGKKFGSVWTDKNRVVNISKQAAVAPFKNWHFIGAMFFSPEILKRIPDNKELNIFYDILVPELANDKVEIYPLECTWFETGNPKDYLNATKEMLNNMTPELLKFISMYDDSELVKNKQTTSLVSKSINFPKTEMFGHNVVSSTAQLRVDTIKESVIFKDQILNQARFAGL